MLNFSKIFGISESKLNENSNTRSLEAHLNGQKLFDVKLEPKKSNKIQPASPDKIKSENKDNNTKQISSLDKKQMKKNDTHNNNG